MALPTIYRIMNAIIYNYSFVVFPEHQNVSV